MRVAQYLVAILAASIVMAQDVEAASKCKIVNVASQDTEVTLRKLAISAFAKAKRSGASDRSWLTERVHPKAEFSAWSGDDHIVASGLGLAGLTEMASRISADTYRYDSEPGILVVTSNPCSESTVDFDVVEADGEKIWKVSTTFKDGLISSGVARRYFVVTGSLSENVEHG